MRRIATMAVSLACPVLTASTASALDPTAPSTNELEPPAHSRQHQPESERPLGVPDSRDGSGTAWQPDSTPMYAFHFGGPAWTLMLHGSIFGGWDVQATPRGDSGLMSQNWFMAMARHSDRHLEIQGRVMLSAEPFLVGPRGYPLLLQSGETYRGEPLHDRQHPHDLFMETAAIVTVAPGDDVGFQLYIAPAGEPALGPVAFPHRASAAANPVAPLGHHWQDSTHITYGVLTAGVFTRQVKVEGSWFNGREPDENRYNFDLRVPDSVSGRVSVNPVPPVSFQVSYGFLRSPEALEPTVSVHRLTASASVDTSLGGDRRVAASAIFGMNRPSIGPPTSSCLLEAEATVNRHGTIFGRGELVQKTGADLALSPTIARQRFGAGSLTLGYLHELEPIAAVVPALGALATVDVIGPDLGRWYGTQLPLGGLVYFRIRPAGMAMPTAEGNHANHAP